MKNSITFHVSDAETVVETDSVLLAAKPGREKGRHALSDTLSRR